MLRDAAGRLWITVSTRLSPRDRAYRRDCADGFILLLDGKGLRLVADGLGYTNEVTLDPERGLALRERDLRAAPCPASPCAPAAPWDRARPSLRFGPGCFPDGMALDREGGIWVVSIVSNRIIRVDPDGGQTVMLEDSDAGHLAWVEAAYAEGGLGRPHLDAIVSRRLRKRLQHRLRRPRPAQRPISVACWAIDWPVLLRAAGRRCAGALALRNLRQRGDSTFDRVLPAGR